MYGIGNFFDKFKKGAVNELYKKEIISEIILIVIKEKIDIKDITIKNKIIYIRGNQGLKNEIFIKKEKIINLIVSKISENIIDIK